MALTGGRGVDLAFDHVGGRLINACLRALTGRLCDQFRRWYDVWTQEGFAPIREALRPWMGWFGHPVHITAGSRRLEGTAHDIDETGRLLVRLDSGLLRPFDVGEVTRLR
jgi:biotin-(acetyl-CoA carboxylase) ligase